MRGLANNLYYTPQMFGGGPEVAKPIYDEAVVRYAAFRLRSPLMPTWGERQLRGRLKSYEPKVPAAPAVTAAAAR